MKEKVCVIAVHPDDETLGCGGTIFKHLDRGDEVYCIFVTGGNEVQNKLIGQVSDFYKFTGIKTLNLPELHLSDLNIVIPPLSDAISEIKPTIVYLPNRSDVHSDHRSVFEATIACTKSFRYPSIKALYMIEVISETDFMPALNEMAFIPNHYVDITNQWSRKLQAMEIYKTEMLPYPYTRNNSTQEALNRYRGSQINTEYAEAFMALKTIER